MLIFFIKDAIDHPFVIKSTPNNYASKKLSGSPRISGYTDLGFSSQHHGLSIPSEVFKGNMTFCLKLSHGIINANKNIA